MEHIFPASPAGQSMRWSKFKNNDSRDIYDVMSQRVFPAIKNMKQGRLPDFDERGELVEIPDEAGTGAQSNTAFARYMEDAMFLIPTPQVLQKIITGLEDLYEHDIADLDMQGDLYEYMLGKLATAGQNGQFRTPKHIREMMVELMQPTPDDTICDKTTPRLIQFHTLKNAVNPPFLGGFLIFGTMVAWVGRRPCQGGLLFSVGTPGNDRKTIVTE